MASVQEVEKNSMSGDGNSVWASVWLSTLLVALAYLLAAQVSLSFILEPENIAPHETGTVNGDARLLRALLDNLVGNAWKYTSGNSSAHIEFGQDHQDGKPAFYVKDNGIGFDMNYADKLFTPFHRLHDNDAFSGSGIGLATVQRIVHRHGGRVWAESNPGQGSIFRFTIAD